MPLFVFGAFVLVLTLLETPCPSAGAGRLLASSAAYLAAAAGLTAAVARAGARALRRRPDLYGKILRRHARRLLVVRGWMLGGLAALMLLGLGTFVREGLALGRWPLLPAAACLAPFCAALGVSWLLEYPFYLQSRRTAAAQQFLWGGPPIPEAWGLRDYLDFNLRHQFLFLAVPLSMIVLVGDSLSLYLAPWLGEPQGDFAAAGGTALAALVVFATAPSLIVRIWRTRPMEPGLLRDRLEALCRRLNLRFRRLLVWQTGGRVANAGVLGLLRPFRYVLLSDALIERIPPDHVEAVFAHEAGHLLSHHIVYLTLFAVAAAATSAAGGAALAQAMGNPPWLEETASLALLAAAWIGGFGRISRTFERQSDVIAAWACGPETDRALGRVSPEGAIRVAQALEQVAHLNGLDARQHTWRHGSIDSRVSYLLRLGSVRGSRLPIDRAVRRIKLALGLGLAASVAAVLCLVFW